MDEEGEFVDSAHQRRILHVDMDAFYASIEERKEPRLKQLPLIVAKDPRKTGGRGVVATANYVARKYGVHSAMSDQEALKLCPKAVFRFSGFDLYRSVSSQIHRIFHQYTDMVEYVALDEAYLDVTENKLNLKDPINLGIEIQNKIWQRTHLTCSVGVSYNKFLAKEASDYAKPVGITVIDKKDALEFLKKLPISKFRGVGKKTTPKLLTLGIKNGSDLFRFSQMDLIKHFGKFGYVLYQRARGIDERPVEYQRLRKSIGKERTYGPALNNLQSAKIQLKLLSEMVSQTMADKKQHGKALVLKVRYSNFQTLTRRATFDHFIDNSAKQYLKIATGLLEDMTNGNEGIRLLGITITNLNDLDFENVDLNLFSSK